MLGAIVWFGFFAEPSTTFRLDSRTSTAHITVREGHPVWPADLEPLTLIDNPDLVEPCEFVGFRAVAGATISIEAVGVEPLEIVVTNEKQLPAGEFHCAGGHEIAAPDYVAFAFQKKCSADNCQPPIIRFVGELTVGASISRNDLTAPVLESGVLTMETESLLPAFGRLETTYLLDKGDRLSFGGHANLGSAPVASGLIAEDRLQDDPLGFRVVARVDAKDARVLPYGPEKDETIAVAPSFIERMQSGAQGLVIGLIAAIGLHLTSVLISISDYRDRAREEY